jgi:hypothetical protein
MNYKNLTEQYENNDNNKNNLNSYMNIMLDILHCLKVNLNEIATAIDI